MRETNAMVVICFQNCIFDVLKTTHEAEEKGQQQL